MCIFTAYVQQIGRAGRSGQPASATLYYTKSDLAIQHINEEMKSYCKNYSVYLPKYLSTIFNDKNYVVAVTNSCSICTRTNQNQ